jgi:bifunctional DNA-binding transcriptional regulator/antitoxin component of YhaV-PrlF toxin-antitoxin module
MKVSSNGQVSIPADTRSRWGAAHMVVIDLGDHIVMRPLPDDPIGSLVGKYHGSGRDTDSERRAERRSDRDRDQRKKR